MEESNAMMHVILQALVSASQDQGLKSMQSMMMNMMQTL